LSSCLLSKNIKIRIYKSIILAVVLHVSETWSLTLREEHRLREQGAEENIWTKERLSDGRRSKLRNEELHNLYSSPSIIRMIMSRRVRWAGHVARMGEKRNAYRALVGKPEGKRPLGRRRCRWGDNIKVDLREIGWDGMDWIDLTQDMDQGRALVSTVINLQVP
jgi:hypothetical protein